MSWITKLFFFAVIAATVGGVVAHSNYHHLHQAARVGATNASLVEPPPAVDNDVLKADNSWVRWRSLTDF